VQYTYFDILPTTLVEILQADNAHFNKQNQNNSRFTKHTKSLHSALYTLEMFISIISPKDWPRSLYRFMQRTFASELQTTEQCFVLKKLKWLMGLK